MNTVEGEVGTNTYFHVGHYNFFHLTIVEVTNFAEKLSRHCAELEQGVHKKTSLCQLSSRNVYVPAQQHHLLVIVKPLSVDPVLQGFSKDSGSTQLARAAHLLAFQILVREEGK